MSLSSQCLIAPCYQLQPPKFRVGSLWSGKESHLALMGRTFTSISRIVIRFSRFSCFPNPGHTLLFSRSSYQERIAPLCNLQSIDTEDRFHTKWDAYRNLTFFSLEYYNGDKEYEYLILLSGFPVPYLVFQYRFFLNP